MVSSCYNGGDYNDYDDDGGDYSDCGEDNDDMVVMMMKTMMTGDDAKDQILSLRSYGAGKKSKTGEKTTHLMTRPRICKFHQHALETKC